jgi:hypothetical protein
VLQEAQVTRESAGTRENLFSLIAAEGTSFPTWLPAKKKTISPEIKIEETKRNTKQKLVTTKMVNF